MGHGMLRSAKIVLKRSIKNTMIKEKQVTRGFGSEIN